MNGIHSLKNLHFWDFTLLKERIFFPSYLLSVRITVVWNVSVSLTVSLWLTHQPSLGQRSSGIIRRAWSGGCFLPEVVKLQYGKQLVFLRLYEVCLCYVKEELGIADEFNK